MNHDIAHCSGSDVRLTPYGGTEVIQCQLRHQCLRFKAYNDPQRPPVVWMLLPLECIDNNHNDFKEIQKGV